MVTDIGVIGAGGWGIALASVLADRGETTTLWCHGTESFREIDETRESRTYLPGILLPSGVTVTRSLPQAVAGKLLVICAVPSHAARGVMSEAAPHVHAETL